MRRAGEQAMRACVGIGWRHRLWTRGNWSLNHAQDQGINGQTACPMLEDERTYGRHREIDAIDPEQTFDSEIYLANAAAQFSIGCGDLGYAWAGRAPALVAV